MSWLSLLSTSTIPQPLGWPAAGATRHPLVGKAVEDIEGGVRHSCLLSDNGAGSGGGNAADGVQPLNGGDLVENARPVLRCHSEQHPGNGSRVRGAFVDNRPDHSAAAHALPGGTAK